MKKSLSLCYNSNILRYLFGDTMKTISVSDSIVKYINDNKRDYRLSTSCGGPVILPVAIKKPKPNDLKQKVGDYTLYISASLAPYIDVIDETMLLSY